MSTRLPMFRPGQEIADGLRAVINRHVYDWLSALRRLVVFGSVPVGGVILVRISAAVVASDFDATGLGITGRQFEGWAICNGSNGTDDLNGVFLVGDTAGGGAAGTFGATGADYASFGLVPLMRLDRS